MKCFRLRCYVNNSFLVFHQGTKHSKTIKHSRFALVFHTVFSCLDPLMKHSNSLFTYNVKRSELHSRQTRNNNQLDIPLFRTVSGQRTFYYRAVKIWNSLENELREIQSLRLFKRKLKTYFLDSLLLKEHD
jgi:hypothetical protein